MGAQCNQQTLKLAAHHEAIRAEVERRPDVTLEELRGWLVETHGIEASLGLMHNTLIRLGLTLKKTGRAEEQDRADIAEQRTAWRAEQGLMSRGRLIFIPVDLHRRDRGIDEDGSALWALPPRRAARRGLAALRGLLAAFPSGIG